MHEIALQPKQSKIYRALTKGEASWIGFGGGRGCGKSAAIDMIALSLALEFPGVLICIAMRNFDQVRKYHIEPMLRMFPDLADRDLYQASKFKILIPVGGKTSEIDFSYAENYEAVERRFRSANYRFILIDQAEQFVKEELVEIKKACRDSEPAKLLLSFNMGGAGIQTLRKWFHDCEYNERQNPKDYTFVHVFPWDNVHWVRSELGKDGLDERDYYSWTDRQRMEYAAIRGEYTRSLNSDDDSIRARDWLGSWDSLEGAYYGRVFDRQSTMVTPSQVAGLVKPWHSRWLSQDWGKAHYCATYWHCKVTLSPNLCKDVLGWDVARSVNAVITYRELIVNELGSAEVAKRIVAESPESERESIRRFFLSPDAFGERDSGNTIAEKQGKELRPFGLPFPEPADTDRIGGASLIYNLLAETKRHGSSSTEEDIWLISSECSELLNTIPMMMRDPKNLDDVLKTDKGYARLEQDVFEAARYGLKSMLKANMVVPRKVQAAAIADKVYEYPHAREMALQVFHSQTPVAKRRSNWRRY